MSTVTSTRRLHFHGQGGKLFSIFLVNMILTVLTLGIYYPWARVAVMRYMYQETELDGSRFMFHGTGKELFLGFIKALLIFGSLNLLFILLLSTEDLILTIIGFLMFYSSMMTLIPIAIHGAASYRLSRTSWRGIHFGYRGSRSELMRRFHLDALLTLVTLGIYSAWLTVHVRRYVLGHMRFGNVEFRYTARGSEYLILHLKGYFFTLLTGGIYLFWYVKNIFNFWVNNTCLVQNGQKISLRAHATGGDFFKLLFPNIMLVVFTLGLGTPWAMARSMRFMLKHITIEGALDTNSILQTEKIYKDATGVQMADMLDLDFIS